MQTGIYKHIYAHIHRAFTNGPIFTHRHTYMHRYLNESTPDLNSCHIYLSPLGVSRVPRMCLHLKHIKQVNEGGISRNTNKQLIITLQMSVGAICRVRPSALTDYEPCSKRIILTSVPLITGTITVK